MNRSWDRRDAAGLPHRIPDKLIDSVPLFFDVFVVCRVLTWMSFAWVLPLVIS